jgi:hypothetical protein
MRWSIVVLVVVGCGCGGSVGDECRGAGDCDSDLFCADSDDPPVCGIGPREECSDDTQCAGARCHAVADSCSADGIGSMCGPACVGDSECGGAGFRCDAGACVVVLCNAGFACVPQQVCDPARIAATTPVYDRHHGCFAVPCANDGECSGRLCVNGTCQDAPGTCSEPMLVP